MKPGGFYVIEDVRSSFVYAVEDCFCTTYQMITNHMKPNGKIQSKYMTQAEADYITANIEYSNLFSRHDGNSITWIVKKKSRRSPPA